MDQPRRAPFGARAYDLDRRPPPAAWASTAARRVAAASVDGHAAARTHTASASCARAERDVADVVVGRAVLAVRRDGTRARPRPGRGPAAARTPRAACPRRRRTRPAWTSSHVRYRLRFARPGTRATRAPNASHQRAAVAGTGAASGTSTIAPRPPTRTHAHGLHRQASLVLGRRPHHEPAPTRAPVRRRGRSRRGTLDHSGRRPSTGSPRAGGRRQLPSSAATAGRRHRAQHGGERRHVALAHPAGEREQSLVEEAHRRHGFMTGSIRAGRSSVGPRTQPRDSLPVERHLHSEPTPAVELGRQDIGERPVERQERAVDADRDRPGEDRCEASRRRCGGRRRGRSPPRGTPCARNARRRRSRGRSAGARSRSRMIAAGRKSKTSQTAVCDERPGSTCSVPNVSTISDTGCAVPIAYATWSWHRSARPAATTFLAT